MLGAVEGCDAIIHFGGQGLEATFAKILNDSIVGTYNIYEAARQKGVKRIIYASSIHAIGFYERNQTVDAGMPTRPDSLYGVSKTFGENLSRYYFDKFGIESVCIRIGSCFPKAHSTSGTSSPGCPIATSARSSNWRCRRRASAT